MPTQKGPRDLVEGICEEIGLEVAHVDPKKAGTVSNLEKSNGPEQAGWMSLQSEQYFLRKSATGLLRSPALLQGVGVSDGKARHVRWDHASQTLNVLGGESPDSPSECVLNMKDGFHKMDEACSESLRVAFREVVLRFALNVR